MITWIQGRLATASPLRATIELNGLGYDVNIPVTTAERLPPPGTTATLHTHVVYREDSQTLYGFTTAAERDFFRVMIGNVTGVGPKVALTIMSKLSLDLLESAIRLGDVATLAQCPGIGKKLAERLVVELRSKVGDATGISPVSGGTGESKGESAHRDAVAALVALGYRAADADQAVRKASHDLGHGATTEKLIKKALN